MKVSQEDTFKTLPLWTPQLEVPFLCKTALLPHYSQVSLEVNSIMLNVCSPLNQDGIPQASLHHYSIISRFYFHKSNNTPWPNRKEKKTNCPWNSNSIRGGKVYCWKNFVSYLSDPSSWIYEQGEHNKNFFLGKRTWQQRQTWLRKGQDRVQGS